MQGRTEQITDCAVFIGNIIPNALECKFVDTSEKNMSYLSFHYTLDIQLFCNCNIIVYVVRHVKV